MQSTSRNTKVMVAGLGLLAAVATFALCGSSRVDPAAAPRPVVERFDRAGGESRLDAPTRAILEPEESLPISDPAAVPGAYRAPVGTELDFSVETKATARIHRRQGGGGPPLDYRIGGRLRLTVVARRGEELVLRLQLEDSKIELRAGDRRSPQKASELSEDLAAPSFVRMRNDGTTLGYRFPPGMDFQNRNCVRVLVDLMRHVIPDEAERAWQTEESEASGRARIRYSWCDQSSEDPLRKLRKEKLGYVEDAGPSGRPCRMEGSGQGFGYYDPRLGWIVGARIEERNLMPVAELDAVIEQTLQAEMELLDRRLVSTVDLEPVDWSAPWSVALGPQDAQRHAKEHARRRYAKLLKGVTVEQLARELAQLLAAGEGSSHELTLACRKTIWLLRLDPEAAVKFGAIIEQNQQDRDLSSLLLSIAARAGTAECQDVLAGLSTSVQCSLELRRQATESMFLLDEPTRTSVEAAQRLMRDGPKPLAVSGLLMLGAFAGKSDAAHDMDLPGLLRATHETASRNGRLVPWLLAVGNAGRAELAGRVQPYLEASDIEVQRAAFDALRKMRAPAVTTILVERLGSERDPGLRAMAVAQLAQHAGPQAQRAVTRSLFNDGDEHVRKAALAALVEHGADHVVRPLLQRVLREDKSSAVRELAARLLKT